MISRHKRLIYSISLKYGLREEDRDDVFQSVCLILLDKLRSLREKRKFTSWLITMTSRECLRVSKATSHKLAKTIEMKSAENQSLFEDMTVSLDQEIIDLEQEHLLRLGIQKLPPRCQKLLHFLFYEKDSKSYKKISRDLNIPVSSIGPTRARCLVKLRKILKKMGFE
ncbi:MAG: sigma-70 family RNA polymerase sigma factor [Candidatus Zixiibacteriota bacterium]